MLTPSSTYRLQLHEKFTLRDLDAILEYLHTLGISTIYAAPITTAAKGSNHGYDVVDPLRLNPEIGTEEQLAALATRLKNYGITWLQDVVPNHMAYDTANPWLYDALERGPYSRYYRYFDIITDHPVELLGDKLMAPFLGATLTECLQKGELTLQFTGAGFVIRYFDNDYPVAARLYRWICTVADGYPAGMSTALDALEQALPADQHAWMTAKTQWLQRMNANVAWADFVSARLQFFNQRVHLLESLLQSQYYVLTHHRLASSHINYRRFFTVNSLICLRMEDMDVFREYHSAIHRWYTNGWINGLRIDHIDGLADPKQYLQRLKTLFGEETYIVAEKILTGEERMPTDWPLAGSTGYDFLAAAGQLLTDADGSRELLDFYSRHVIDLPPYPNIVYERKLDYLWRYMGGELDNLMDLLTGLPSLLPGGPRPSPSDRRRPSDLGDCPISACPASAATQYKQRLKQALATWMASFPVYRAYPDAAGGSAEDDAHFSTALTQARTRRPDLLAELNFLGDIAQHGPATMPGQPSTATEAENSVQAQRLTFLSRLMQFTGPLAAKGIEDTTFYVYNPYIAHNEVGDSPSVAGITPEDFHRHMQDRQQKQRHSLNATTTHDTKRGEDSRIRLSTLSAQPQEWITAVTRWRELNASLITPVGPAPNDEYLIYQALLGGFPAGGIVTDTFRERFSGYLTKALREAKTETNYEEPDEAYEQQCQTFAAGILKSDSPFLEEFVPFAHAVIRRSAVYSLSLLLLKLTAPGIPDIYQGAELWEESFVDPDNRRLVDFSLRTTLLQQLKTAAAQGNTALFDFLGNHRDLGVEKLFTLYRTLEYRNTRRELFSEGAYIPLPCQDPWLAFLRRHADQWALIAVPLIRYGVPAPTPLSLTLPPDAPATWTDQFTGETIEIRAAVETLASGASRETRAATLRWPDHFTAASPGNAAWPVILLSARTGQ